MPLKSTEEWDRSEKLSIPGQSSPDFAASHLLRALGPVFSRAGAFKRTRSLSDTRRPCLRRAGSDNRISVGRFRTLPSSADKRSTHWCDQANH
jgi:hypothetical protein